MRIAAAAALLAVLTASEALAQSPSQPSTSPAAKAPKTQPPKAPAAKTPSIKAPAAKVPAQPPLAVLAAAGEREAQYRLAQAYRDGKGVKRDVAEAVFWFSLAASNGEKAAAIDLARLYEQGVRVKHDPALAALWWFRAGMLGDEDAKARFLTLFLNGATRDIGGATGISWLETLANSGRTDVVLALGQTYEKGFGIPADREKARQWYQLAAFSGDAEAKFRLGRMLLNAPGGWRLIYTDPEREAKNAERDKVYTSRDEAKQIGGDERIPDPVRPGMVDGEQWLREAALQGHAEAQYTLGMAFLNGTDLPFNIFEALHWLSAAAYGGHAGALMQLADLAAKGQGFGGKDPIRAWVSYDLAAGEGIKPAEDARDRLAKTMNQRQLARARQVAQDIRGN